MEFFCLHCVSLCVETRIFLSDLPQCRQHRQASRLQLYCSLKYSQQWKVIYIFKTCHVATIKTLEFVSSFIKAYGFCTENGFLRLTFQSVSVCLSVTVQSGSEKQVCGCHGYIERLTFTNYFELGSPHFFTVYASNLRHFCLSGNITKLCWNLDFHFQNYFRNFFSVESLTFTGTNVSADIMMDIINIF